MTPPVRALSHLARGQKAARSPLSAAGALVVTTVALLATTSDVYASSAKLPTPRRAHAAVIGGQSAEPGTFPWMAYILDLRGREGGQCSGTVVAPNLILTAAHCAEDVKTGVPNEAVGYQVLTGNVDASSPVTVGQVSGVARVIPCPCFDRATKVGDVALLELSTPTRAPAITLAPRPPDATTMIFAGWGLTSPGQQTPVTRLQSGQTLLQRPGTCELEASPFAPGSEICVLDPPADSTGLCRGDSGGPLLEPQPSAVGGMVQVGVTSHGYDECSTSSPSVFTRVDAIATWVDGWAQALAQPPGTAAPSTVAPPALAGVATSQSFQLRGNVVSLVIGCDGEGGTCSGNVQATITVKEKLVEVRGGRRTVLFTRKRKVTLADDRFAMAAGSSVAIRSRLSSQSRSVLSRLGSGVLDVKLVGHGIAPQIVSLVKR